LLSGPTDDATAQALMDACEDMLLGTQGDRLSADFDRNGATLEDAVLSAIRDLEAASARVTVYRVEPDDLVTATVIAERIGRTRQSVALLVAGERGPGDFPQPLSFVDAKTRIWRWSEVAEWLESAGAVSDTGAPGAARERRFLAALNGALEARVNLRAYRNGGGDNAIVAEIREIAAGSWTSHTRHTAGLSEADGGRDVTLRTGIDLLDLAVSLLKDDNTDGWRRHEHVVPEWMHTSIAGYAGTLRLHVSGQQVDSSPFEELVAAGMTCAALARISSSERTLSLFPSIESTRSDLPLSECPHCLKEQKRLGGSIVGIAHHRSAWVHRSRDIDLRAVLVDGLRAPDRVAQRITIWLTHGSQDHLDGIASLVDLSSLIAVDTLNWDELVAQALASTRWPNHSQLSAFGNVGVEEPLGRWAPVSLSGSQRLWATTWSFGQTLRLFTEQACPRRSTAVSSALAALERVP
jgi:hypothetical protein